MSVLPSSVLQDTAHHKVSDKYTHINTTLIIDKLLNNGFELHEAKEANVRKLDNMGYQKHLVTLKYSELETSEGVPTVVIRNSHNRSSSLSLFSGYIRFACFNGLIAGSSIESVSMQHKRNWEQDVDSFLMGYQSKINKLHNEYESMKLFRMSSYDEKRFTQQAAELRYPIDDYMDYRELSRVRRVEDRGDNLWVVFNRVQENILKGDFERKVISESEELGKIETWGKARIITDNDEILRINRSLHNLAMRYVS